MLKHSNVLLLTESQSPTLNFVVMRYLWGNDDETYEVILLKIHSIQVTSPVAIYFIAVIDVIVM